MLDDPRAYPPYLATGYHVTCAMLELMDAALERARELAPSDAVAEPLADYLERHLIEETHHEEPGGAILDDLSAAGADVAALVEVAKSERIATLLALQHGWIRDEHPVAVLGFLELEVYYAELPVVEQLIARSGLPRAAFGQLLEHATLDAMHAVQLHQLLDSLPLTPEQEQLVGLSALTTFRLVAEALLDTVGKVRASIAYDRSDTIRGGVMAAWKTTQIHEIDEITDGRVPWRPVRHHFGIESFGINVFNGKEAGDRLINEHDEADDEQEELYFVHSGRARFELDGETLDAGPGTFVYAEPGVKRTAFAEEPNTNLIALGGVPGKAYETHGWEIWAPLQPLYRAGEYDQVADRLESELPEDAKWPMLHYNAACIYSLAGRKEKALTHLSRAMELAPDNVRGYAEGDDDLANIRDEPRFKELLTP